jgi:protein required for attachment to host cells
MTTSLTRSAQSSSADPSDSRQDEASYAVGTAAVLNKRVLYGKVDALIIVAAPCTLGELRKHYQRHDQRFWLARCQRT